MVGAKRIRREKLREGNREGYARSLERKRAEDVRDNTVEHMWEQVNG